MTVALPDGEDGVYSAIGYAFDAPSDERTVHVDRFGGQVVSTYGYDDYPLLAKVVSQGIGWHEGRSLGLVSFWAAAAMCALVIASCVTGPLMWWRRRRRGAGLGAPRGRMPIAASPWLLVGLIALGVLLPFFGVTLLVVLLLDQLVVRRVPFLGRWFSATSSGTAGGGAGDAEGSQRRVRVGNRDGDRAAVDQVEAQGRACPHGADGPSGGPPEAVAHGPPRNVDDRGVRDGGEGVLRPWPAEDPQWMLTPWGPQEARTSEAVTTSPRSPTSAITVKATTVSGTDPLLAARPIRGTSRSPLTITLGQLVARPV